MIDPHIAFLGGGYSGKQLAPILAEAYCQLIRNTGKNAVLLTNKTDDVPAESSGTLPLIVSLAKQRNDCPDTAHCVWVMSYADSDLSKAVEGKQKNDCCFVVGLDPRFPLLNEILRKRAAGKLLQTTLIETDIGQESASLSKILAWRNQTTTAPPPTVSSPAPESKTVSTAPTPTLKETDDSVSNITYQSITSATSRRLGFDILKLVTLFFGMPLENLYKQEKEKKHPESDTVPDPFVNPLMQSYENMQRFVSTLTSQDAQLGIACLVLLCHRLRQETQDTEPEIAIYNSILHLIPQNHSHFFLLYKMIFALKLESQINNEGYEFLYTTLKKTLLEIKNATPPFINHSDIWEERKLLCQAVVLRVITYLNKKQSVQSDEQQDLLILSQKLKPEAINALDIQTLLAVSQAKASLDGLL